jgi:DNA-binding transcriptional ArsR family regulator
MVNYSATLDTTFGALADPTRRAILAQLARGESSVTQLARQFDISLPGVVKHVRVLEESGLLTSEKTGRVRRCRLEPQRLRTAGEWIAFYQQFWEQQLDSLAQYFEELSEKEKHAWQKGNRSRATRSTSGAQSARPSKKYSKHSQSRKS